DTHEHASRKQLKEALRQTANRGEEAPESQAGGNQPWPVAPFRQSGNRKRHRRIKERKGESRHQSDLRIAELEILSDWFDQNIDDKPVNRVERADAQQESEHTGTIGGGRRYHATYHLLFKCVFPSALAIGEVGTS